MSAQPPEQPPKNRTTDYLANERTFLAWVRTSLAAISLGFVIARFSFWLRELSAVGTNVTPSPQTGLSLPLGLGMILYGAVSMVLAVIRFRIVNEQIRQGGAQPSMGLILFMAAGVLALAGALIAYLLIISGGW